VNDTLGKYLLRKRIEKVVPHIRGKLVDIGCGTNELCAAYGKDAVGVDVYPWPGVDQVVTNTADLPFKSKSIDTVTIIAALNHIPNRNEVLKEAHRILNDNGRLIITMIPPFISTVWHTLRKPWDVDQSERGMKEGEVYGLSPAAIRKLINENGFEVKEEHPFMLGVNRLYVALKK